MVVQTPRPPFILISEPFMRCATWEAQHTQAATCGRRAQHVLDLLLRFPLILDLGQGSVAIFNILKEPVRAICIIGLESRVQKAGGPQVLWSPAACEPFVTFFKWKVGILKQNKTFVFIHPFQHLI